jgi:hypothetical protein
MPHYRAVVRIGKKWFKSPSKKMLLKEMGMPT